MDMFKCILSAFLKNDFKNLNFKEIKERINSWIFESGPENYLAKKFI